MGLLFKGGTRSQAIAHVLVLQDLQLSCWMRKGSNMIPPPDSSGGPAILAVAVVCASCQFNIKQPYNKRKATRRRACSLVNSNLAVFSTAQTNATTFFHC